MTFFINADTLKREIKKQIRELEKSIASQGDYGQSCAIANYKDILDLIESLQGKEPVANVEKVAEECWRTDFNMETDQYARLSMRHDDFMNFARYFAEVGERAERDRIRSAVEEIRKQYQAVDKCLNDIKNFFV